MPHHMQVMILNSFFRVVGVISYMIWIDPYWVACLSLPLPGRLVLSSTYGFSPYASLSPRMSTERSTHSHSNSFPLLLCYRLAVSSYLPLCAFFASFVIVTPILVALNRLSVGLWRSKHRQAWGCLPLCADHPYLIDGDFINLTFHWLEELHAYSVECNFLITSEWLDNL